MRRQSDDVPLTLHFDPSGSLLEATLACEREVFAERYDLSDAALEQYWAPYAESSSFLALADEEGTVHGMSRIVFPGPAGLITLVDVGHEPWSIDAAASFERTGLDPRRTCDVATIALRAGGRPAGMTQAAGLYHGLIQVARANDVQGFLAILDQRVRRMLGQLGIWMNTLPGTSTAPYWGSPATTPIWADVAEVVATQRRRFPDAYRLVTLGTGLGDITVPPLSAFRRGAAEPAPVELSPASLVDQPMADPMTDPMARPMAAALDLRQRQSADDELTGVRPLSR